MRALTAMCALLIGLISLLVAVWVASLFHQAYDGATPHDDTDPPGGRSGMRLFVDARTGCQYLGGAWSGVTPRLDANGRHICERTSP